jgi:hypothetical protein
VWEVGVSMKWVWVGIIIPATIVNVSLNLQINIFLLHPFKWLWAKEGIDWILNEWKHVLVKYDRLLPLRLGHPWSTLQVLIVAVLNSFFRLFSQFHGSINYAVFPLMPVNLQLRAGNGTLHNTRFWLQVARVIFYLTSGAPYFLPI